MTTARPRKRTTLLIRCTGRTVHRVTLKPRGPTCGTVFTSERPYKSRADWIERARAAGWRVSPLQADNTVIACCPSCVSGTKPKTKERT